MMGSHLLLSWFCRLRFMHHWINVTVYSRCVWVGGIAEVRIEMGKLKILVYAEAVIGTPFFMASTPSIRARQPCPPVCLSREQHGNHLLDWTQTWQVSYWWPEDVRGAIWTCDEFDINKNLSNFTLRAFSFARLSPNTDSGTLPLQPTWWWKTALHPFWTPKKTEQQTQQKLSSGKKLFEFLYFGPSASWNSSRRGLWVVPQGTTRGQSRCFGFEIYSQWKKKLTIDCGN